MMDDHDSFETLEYILNHVFLPPKLPEEDDGSIEPNPGDVSLCRLAYEAATNFQEYLSDDDERAEWSVVIKLLRELLATTETLRKEDQVRKILDMEDKDALALYIRAQNAALILRRNSDRVVFETFEVQPPPTDVMEAEGKLLCSYPGPAVELPLEIAQNPSFVEQFVSFLGHMDVDQLDSAQTAKKAGSTVQETRSTADPKYITQLLVAILHGMGQEAHVERITKRIADEVCCSKGQNPWRRSPVWLVLRVAVQRVSKSREVYKAFMLFFHARLLRMFLDHDFSSDLLFTARVKTARRAYKLKNPEFSSLLDMVRGVTEEVEATLKVRWEKEQKLQAALPSLSLDPTTIENDTTLSLMQSRAYLSQVLCPSSRPEVPVPFQPSHHPRLGDQDRDMSNTDASTLEQAVKADPYIALADFERMIQEQLKDWIYDNIENTLASEVLDAWFDQYYAAAKTHYQSNAENQSVMLLTILELWVALDTIVCKQYPLLSAYSPEIPISILEPLLLRHAVSLQRAAAIEQYLRGRHSEVDVHLDSIYSPEITSTSFSVRYFDSSLNQQDMKSSIERAATEDRVAKRTELRQANEKHAQLQSAISRRNCDYTTRTNWYGGTWQQHDRHCIKCDIEEQARRMTINVHEWPLSENTLEAKATVFEMDCPVGFAIWRDLTYQILRDIGMAQVSTEHIKASVIEDYSVLKPWFTLRRKWSRITLGSKTMSILNTHYREAKIPATESETCVNNGLKFKLYDKVRMEPTRSTFPIDNHQYCTLRLPTKMESIYGHLQYAVSGTDHAHNSTIVKQSDCPANLSLHEQLSFANLRCGAMLQWLNIARELRTRIMTFATDEVHTLFTQAAWQIGPLSDTGSLRIWHSELQVASFGHALTQEANSLLSHVETNWMETNTVRTIIYLVGRLLASKTDQLVIRKGYAVLRNARRITHQWMRQILAKLEGLGNKEDAISGLQRRLCEVATACRATFDVDIDPHLPALLSSSADVAIFVECAIVIHDNTPRHLGNSFPEFQRMLHRDRRLSHFLESSVAEWIEADRHGLDAAITSVWSAYRSSEEGWMQLYEPNSRWVTTSTKPASDQRAQQVHYNILSGQLLIDGKPLGRLPQDILAHPTYMQIFGQKIFDIIPSDMAGMDYATRHLVHNSQVFFALRDNGQRLIVRAQERGTSNTLELIPHDMLEKDFPYIFTADHVHWMDIKIGHIEFRPIGRLWEQSTHSNWRLEFSTDGASFLFHGEDRKKKLVDIRSDTFRGIASRLQSLEYPQYLTIFTDGDRPQQSPSIELPRFELSFFVNDHNELESANMQGMIVDVNRHTGTMIGLSTQLVLCHKEADFGSLPRSRSIIIPYGRIYSSISNNHVRVHIDTHSPSMRQVTWYKYDIDYDLGHLVGNASLTSRLLNIYLHALCSHPLPDPLTGQRGTDYALRELRASACFSFQQLTTTDIELLGYIRKITPTRNYYPVQFSGMQATAWSPNLHFLSQHRLFDEAVSKIMQFAKSLTIFPELDRKIDDKCCSGDPTLTARAGRVAIYHEGDFNSTSCSDRKYFSRDFRPNSTGETKARNTSRLIYNWPTGLSADPSTFFGLRKIFENWGTMHGVMTETSLVYSKSWLHLKLPNQWLSIYNACRRIRHPDTEKFVLIFSLGALAYRNEPDLLENIPILLSCAALDSSLLDEPPKHSLYDLSRGYEPRQAEIAKLVTNGVYSRENSPAADLSRHWNEDPEVYRSRVERYYRDTSRNEIEKAVTHLLSQWPCSNPQMPFLSGARRWFRSESIMEGVTEYFEICFSNRALQTFASNVSKTLQENYVTFSSIERCPLDLSFSPQYDVEPWRNPNPLLTLESLFSCRQVPSLQRLSRKFGEFGAQATHELSSPISTTALASLVAKFQTNHTTALHQMYRDRLEESQKELGIQRILVSFTERNCAIEVCKAFRKKCLRRLSGVFLSISNALAPITCADHIIKDAGLWPTISQYTVLQLLAPTTGTGRLPEWNEILTIFAQSFIEYQYSQRLVGFCLRSEISNFVKEVDNASFDFIDAQRYPEWLLIQIQGNFIVRPIQSRVAKEMIKPSLGGNIVLQLNMGEGKSHVIAPIVAAALADSQKLVRVIVLKPLCKQMFQLLVERMSGLPNRRVFFLPFSRDVKATPRTIQSIRSIFEECARVRGILVAQPEHILSFRLMVIDQILMSDGAALSPVARDLRATHDWLFSAARDILDESDELLHARYQLIYTMDQQQPLDSTPDRWIIVQKVFDIVRQHMGQLHKTFPEEVELIEHRARASDEAMFPYFRLLGATASQKLVSLVAKDLLDGKVENMTFVGLPSQPSLRAALHCFLTVSNVDSESSRLVKEKYGSFSLWKGLLLLRGLIAHGILVYVLSSRRWRVDYGLDPKRSLLAVPYRAKDVPSLRSEFGHPDIVLCLTCLTYYYGGLTPDQVKDCFDLLVKLDNPSLEYENWVRRDSNIPPEISQIIGVNMKDMDMFNSVVVPTFQNNKGVIDFYLSHVVFPKEAKEFPSKLGTSAWDLAETRTHFTTGFSGTNDNSDLLPTSISQSDPVNQLRTNAQVLEYLLQPENKRYLCTRGKDGQSCSAAELVNTLATEPEEVRVLLDVGAQMLEMTNRQLVEHWLSLTSRDDVAAGVFFDDSDNLSVITREGSVEPLYSSPFFQRLHQCVIYLDDAHTRGTDLKLPPRFRALVTLGPKVTKDKLVQGCMRMRNLGHGQSVMFCAPPEVDRLIRKTEKIDSSDPVEVADVLSWAMANTCEDIRNHMPHWVQQGVYYHKRQAGYATFSESTSGELSIEPLKDSWLEPAARILDDMYGVEHERSSDVADVVGGIPAMHDRLKKLGFETVRDESMAEEQEREVSHEMEEEPLRERPPPLAPAKHVLSPEVKSFVESGAILAGSSVFLPLFTPLQSDNFARESHVAKRLLATLDFATTTATGKERSALTDYLRPVNWIVSHIGQDSTLTLVVMSPFEVNALLGDIRKSKHVRLHVYAPRTTQSMKSFDSLGFYCVPPVARRATVPGSLANDIGCQLNIFAGQLFLDKYETYLRLCLLLGVASDESDENDAVENDRFVRPSARTEEMEAVCLFDQSPLPMLQTLLGLRRKGMSFQSTHMGKILQARLLSKKDFEK